MVFSPPRTESYHIFPSICFLNEAHIYIIIVNKQILSNTWHRLLMIWLVWFCCANYLSAITVPPLPKPEKWFKYEGMLEPLKICVRANYIFFWSLGTKNLVKAHNYNPTKLKHFHPCKAHKMIFFWLRWHNTSAKALFLITLALQKKHFSYFLSLPYKHWSILISILNFTIKQCNNGHDTTDKQ